MKRRGFLLDLFSFVPLSLGFLGITKMSFGFLSPKDKTKKRKVFVSNIHDIPMKQSKEVTDLRGKKFILIRTEERTVSALSTVCTHLGCSVHWESNKDIFFCPCHNGVFDAKGKVVSGPPPRDLDSYETIVEGDNIYVYMEEKQA